MASAPARSALGVRRAERWGALEKQPLDLLVVGGGITGSSVAALAAGPGRRVGLLERDDFASGTSGATSKMLHGGLRYLQHGKLGLVRESLRERSHLVRELGETRVRVTPFLLPLGPSLRGRLSLGLGTWLYQRLAGGASLGPRRRIDASEVARLAPALALPGLAGAIVYPEGVVDDAALTVGRALQARDRGAWVLNHAEVLALELDAGRVTGIRARDRLDGSEHHVRATRVVNATGVWSPRWAGPQRVPALRPSQGVHLVFSQVRWPLSVAVVLSAPDGRWVFALPYGPHTILGTTDTELREVPDATRPRPEDVRYLLDIAAERFPSLALGTDDVLDAYAGVRPLLDGGGARTNELSREDVVHRDGSGLLTVVGGKLTTHRAMAARTLSAMALSPGSPGEPEPPVPVFPPAGGEPPSAGAAQVLRALAGPPESWAPLLRPWVEAAVTEFEAWTVADVLDRRLHALCRRHPAYPALVRLVASWMAPLVGWSDAESARQAEDHLARVHWLHEALPRGAGRSSTGP